MKRLATMLLMAGGILSAQAPAPLYRVTVTARSVKAVSYQHRRGETKIDFAGTALMPDAHGSAKVEGKKGFIAIDAEFRDMPPATRFGAEYLTYVLWAVTPDGRTSNLGEIIRNGQDGKLEVTTTLQEFALIVTAEPYFAVSRPSDVVAMDRPMPIDVEKNRIELAYPMAATTASSPVRDRNRMLARSPAKIAMRPTAPAPVMTRMWRRIEPVTNFGARASRRGVTAAVMNVPLEPCAWRGD